MGLKQFDIQQKILWHQDRINKWLKDETVYPITIEIDPSNACNERCIWCCWEEHRNDKTVMSWELIEKIIKDLAKVGVKGLIWTGGGEPLVNKHVPKGMELAKSLGMENGMFTNGILMTPNILPTIVKCCTWIRISLGAATAETFKKCHGTDDFNKIINNIKEFMKLKKELNKDIAIGISMMVHPENYHELYDEAKMAKELGVDYFQGKPLNQMGSEDMKWWNGKVIPLFKKAKDELEDDDFRILTAQYTQDKYGDEGSKFLSDITPSLEVAEEEKKKCYVHNFVTAITANGDVAFCKNLRDRKEFILGNLKTQTMEEIWNSDRRKELIKKINTDQCAVFCQNGRLNQILRYMKKPDNKKHPNFL
ncbi:radical SAM protein [candidate division KSB1 bacterium]